MEFKHIHARRILTPVGWVENGIITITDGTITAITQSDKLCSNDITIMPALIDTHIHGVMGVDTMDTTHAALNTMSCFLAKHGVGAFLATTVTESNEYIENALFQVKKVLSKVLMVQCY